MSETKINGDVDKKKWGISALDGTRFDFFPIWELPDKDALKDSVQMGKEIECRFIDIKIGEKVHRFNYLDLFMFMYFTANEEMRLNLAMRMERQVTYIPYEVSFKLDKEEKETGLAKRHIKLPVDDITMAIARSEALALKDPVSGKVPDWVMKGKSNNKK